MLVSSRGETRLRIVLYSDRSISLIKQARNPVSAAEKNQQGRSPREVQSEQVVIILYTFLSEERLAAQNSEFDDHETRDKNQILPGTWRDKKKKCIKLPVSHVRKKM